MGIQLEGDLPVLNDLIGSSIVSKKFYYQWLKLLSSGINIIVNNKWLSPYLCFCFCLFLVILLHLFSRSNIPKPRPFFRDQIFSNRYWDIFCDQFSETQNEHPQKNLANVSKPRCHTLFITTKNDILLSRKVELDLHLTRDRLQNNLFMNNPFKGSVRWTQEAPDSVTRCIMIVKFLSA